MTEQLKYFKQGHDFAGDCFLRLTCHYVCCHDCSVYAHKLGGRVASCSSTYYYYYDQQLLLFAKPGLCLPLSSTILFNQHEND